MGFPMDMKLIFPSFPTRFPMVKPPGAGAPPGWEDPGSEMGTLQLPPNTQLPGPVKDAG